MIATSKKFLLGAALLIIISGSETAPCGQATSSQCDAYTCATPPTKPVKRDTTQTKKKKAKKSTKTKKQTTKQK